MAIWNLERGAETAELLACRWPEIRQRLSDEIALMPEGPAEWRRLAGVVETSFDSSGRVLEQFRGFFELKPVDIVTGRSHTVPVDPLLGRERTQDLQVAKQADVVALLALLWEQFPPQVREASPSLLRATHGSRQLAQRTAARVGGGPSGRHRSC
jgi:trehalose/maltose hydrolase-like predicted phosphorylase